jgi:hypothetical protein
MSDADDAARRKQINSLRLSWHETMIADPELHRFSGAVPFGGLVLHRFRVDLGHAEISLPYAMKRLNMKESTVRRGRDALLRRRWIFQKDNPRKAAKGGPWAGTLYAPGTGPDDLDLDVEGEDREDG